MRIYHEMYTAAYHLGPERQAPIPVPWSECMITDKQFSYDWVRRELEGNHSSDGTKVVFCKELGYTMHGHFRNLPAGYRHTFLIRHPAKVFLSMNKLINKRVAKHVLKLNILDLLPDGLLFKELYELFYYVTNTLGQKPLVIDADDLVERPERTLRAYCNEVGITYTSSMMNWNPLKAEEHRWNYSKRLMFVNKVIGQYDRAFSSSRLESIVEKPLDLSTVDPQLLLASEASAQYYEMMYKLRLKPVNGDLDSSLDVIDSDDLDNSSFEMVSFDTPDIGLPRNEDKKTEVVSPPPPPPPPPPENNGYFDMSALIDVLPSPIMSP